MRWPLARGSAAYYPPHPSLLGCVRGYLVRDTTGRPTLPEAARHNRYPATACTSLIWLLEGESMWACPVERAGEALPPTVLLGPQSRPFATFNPGAVRSFGIVFAPGALHRLAGLDMGGLVDQAVPADRSVNAHWRSWCGTVRAARDDTARIQLVEAFLHASLAQLDVPACMPAAAHLALQAEGRGGSARSMARRLRAWLGLSPRDTRTLERLERTLVEAREQDADRTSAWADVAAVGGYSDQAHLCRQARRCTGMSPGELARRANQDEACWLYRVWAEADAPSRPDR